MQFDDPHDLLKRLKWHAERGEQITFSLCFDIDPETGKPYTQIDVLGDMPSMIALFVHAMSEQPAMIYEIVSAAKAVMDSIMDRIAQDETMEPSERERLTELVKHVRNMKVTAMKSFGDDDRLHQVDGDHHHNISTDTMIKTFPLSLN